MVYNARWLVGWRYWCNATKRFTAIRTASDTGAHQMLSVQSINCDQVNGAR